MGKVIQQRITQFGRHLRPRRGRPKKKSTDTSSDPFIQQKNSSIRGSTRGAHGNKLFLRHRGEHRKDETNPALKLTAEQLKTAVDECDNLSLGSTSHKSMKAFARGKGVVPNLRPQGQI